MTGDRHRKRILIAITALCLVSLLVLATLAPQAAHAETNRPDEITEVPEDGEMQGEPGETRPDILDEVNSIDWRNLTTGVTDEKYTLAEVKELISPYGYFTGPNGMKKAEFKKAMSYEWEEVTEQGRFKPVNISISKSYTYDDLVNIMKRLSRIEGVRLFDIGRTGEGRTMYAIDVDIPSDKEKETVILTGSTHARETAGTVFILKSLADLLQADTKEAKKVLKTTRFALVPCVNPDGREGVAFDTKNYSVGKTLWKAESTGTDLNRSFPGLSWGMVKSGNKKNENISTRPALAFYPGDRAGACGETQALMKFLYYYVVEKQAKAHIDYHQQGRGIYASKPWQTEAAKQNCLDLMHVMADLTGYRYFAEIPAYGLDGTGSTLTDFACSLAAGAKYSCGYGFYVYTDGRKHEYPLIRIPKPDLSRKKILPPANESFAVMTFEIGTGTECIGYSKKARTLQAEEYSDRNFDRVFYRLSEFAHRKN
ncbi:MAG: hypothetical protein ILP10_05085 [Lachnospiraceae bacterium]|nr:hypothetical protein [Lachnospiraceae bacterium]